MDDVPAIADEAAGGRRRVAARRGGPDGARRRGGRRPLRGRRLRAAPRRRPSAWSCSPTTRGRGLGSALLGRVEASYAGGLTAWSHGNHPAAARLAAAHGWDRVRDLWVMRRSSSLPLPPLEVPDGRDDPVVARRRRRRGRGGQRGRLRAPPRAGRDGPRQPRPPDGRAVVRPGRPARRGGRLGGARLPLDQAARRRGPARSTSSASTRPRRAAGSARCSRSPGCTTSRGSASRRSCSTSSPTTHRPSRSTHGSGSSTRTRTRTCSTAAPYGTPRSRRSRSTSSVLVSGAGGRAGRPRGRR